MPIQFSNRRSRGAVQDVEGREQRLSGSVSIILWRCRMTCLTRLCLVLGFAAMALVAEPAWAQSRATSAEEPAASAASDTAPQPNATAPGPVIFVVDSTRHIALVNVGSLNVKRIGRVNVPLTDIAFNPTNH